MTRTACPKCVLPVTNLPAIVYSRHGPQGCQLRAGFLSGPLGQADARPRRLLPASAHRRPKQGPRPRHHRTGDRLPGCTRPPTSHPKFNLDRKPGQVARPHATAHPGRSVSPMRLCAQRNPAPTTIRPLAAQQKMQTFTRFVPNKPIEGGPPRRASPSARCGRLPLRIVPRRIVLRRPHRLRGLTQVCDFPRLTAWRCSQVAKAADCKSAIAGSNPASAFLAFCCRNPCLLGGCGASRTQAPPRTVADNPYVLRGCGNLWLRTSRQSGGGTAR